MLGKEKKQGDFFNDYVYGELLPEEDTLLSIARLVDFGFVEEEAADLYSEDRGRPSYPPAVLFKMLFLEHYANLSDVEVSKQCRYNLLYRAFVGLGVSDPTPDDTTLVVFRARLGEERFERLFERGELYYFSVSDCQSCPVRTECVKQNEGRARVYLSDDYKLRMKVDPERKREALKVRKAIERKFGEAKKWHGLGRARYRTRAKVAIQAFLVFMVMNLKRMVKLLLQRQRLRGLPAR